MPLRSPPGTAAHDGGRPAEHDTVRCVWEAVVARPFAAVDLVGSAHGWEVLLCGRQVRDLPELLRTLHHQPVPDQAVVIETRRRAREPAVRQSLVQIVRIGGVARLKTQLHEPLENGRKPCVSLDGIKLRLQTRAYRDAG